MSPGPLAPVASVLNTQPQRLPALEMTIKRAEGLDRMSLLHESLTYACIKQDLFSRRTKTLVGNHCLSINNSIKYRSQYGSILVYIVLQAQLL